MKIIEYAENGKITRIVTMPDESFCDELIPFYPKDSHLFLSGDAMEGVDDGTHYVENGIIKQRQCQDIVLTDNVLHGVSSTATVSVNGTPYSCDGSDVELEFEFSGTYVITVSDWPLIDWSTTIENNTQRLLFR